MKETDCQNASDKAVQARNEGVIVKNYIAYGDDTGYKYFCNNACKNLYRDRVTYE